MNSKNWQYLFASIIFIGIIVSFIILRQRIGIEKAHSLSLEDRVKALIIDSSSIQNERWVNNLSLKENGKLLKNRIEFIDNGLATNIASYCDTIKSPKLIIRFSYLGCEVCIDSALSIARKYDSVFHSNNIELWATYENKRDLLLFKNVNKIKYKSYFIKATDTIISADIYSVPYTFVIQPGDRSIHDLFFPLKENAGRTKQYLAVISNKYLFK